MYEESKQSPLASEESESVDRSESSNATDQEIFKSPAHSYREVIKSKINIAY